MPGGFLPVQGIIQRSFGGGEIAPAYHARATNPIRDGPPALSQLHDPEGRRRHEPARAALVNACKTASRR